jgi:hypothetical protein
MSGLVFISHRTADEPIAIVLNEHLQRWQLTEDEIFQSSRALSWRSLVKNGRTRTAVYSRLLLSSAS